MPDPVCDPTKTNCISEKELYPDQPPRLLVGINRYSDRQDIGRERKPRELPDDDHGEPVLGPAGAVYVGEVLDWIAKGFQSSEMELAWNTDAGKAGRVKAGGESAEDMWEVYWAKQVAEMFLLNAYDTPAGAAGFPFGLFSDQMDPAPTPKDPNHKELAFKGYTADVLCFQRLQLEYLPEEDWRRLKYNERTTKIGSLPRVKNTDPAYSLATECQHICTYFLISRGFLLERDMAATGVDASITTAACELFDKTAARWITENEDGCGSLPARFKPSKIDHFTLVSRGFGAGSGSGILPSS